MVFSEKIKLSGLYIVPQSGLDQITVVFRDLGNGSGKIIFTCWDRAWTIHFGAMGKTTIKKFISHCGVDYLLSKCMDYELKGAKRKSEEIYLTKILTAIKEAIQPQNTVEQVH